jgi:enamine deaminase RidA (YjgF/YER057c/UK114 family)
MGKRINLSSGAPWEEKVGYSRAVRIGNHIAVTGTVSLDENGLVSGKDEYEQARNILEMIEKFLQDLGAKRSDIIRTRIFVTNIDNWELVGKAHGEFFKGINPATTLVEVSALIAPEFLLEIEADAVVSS